MTMDITPQPLTRDAFAPFGDVIDIPDRAGRTYYENTVGNLHPGAHPSLSVSLKAETPDRPLKAKMLERHEFSCQTLVPIDVQRWLVVVAPHAAAGGGPISAACAPSSPQASRVSPPRPTPGTTASRYWTGPAASRSPSGAMAPRATRSSFR